MSGTRRLGILLVDTTQFRSLNVPLPKAQPLTEKLGWLNSMSSFSVSEPVPSAVRTQKHIPLVMGEFPNVYIIVDDLPASI